jgi:NAD(P)-dependent dehydrogenase (short-subunit alcohol dehydrogenase family)
VTAGLRCIVTGGGTGIGRGITARLCHDGATVAITGRRLQPLRQTGAELGKERVHAFAADVTDPRSLAAAFGAARQAMGGLDVLVNNAGTGGPNACGLPGPERWDEVIRTNLDGVFHSTRAALPFLQDGGRVINISSVLGRFGVPGYTAYCASKHGVIGFTKALALELAPRRITVNAICPGWVDTEMAQRGFEGIASATGQEFEAARAGALAQVPLGRILQPEEIGDLVVYLCSPGASGMTGQAISLCGGQVMW